MPKGLVSNTVGCEGWANILIFQAMSGYKLDLALSSSKLWTAGL